MSALPLRELGLAREFVDSSDDPASPPATETAIISPADPTRNRRNRKRSSRYCFASCMIPSIAALSPLYTIASLTLALSSQMNAFQSFMLLMTDLPNLLNQSGSTNFDYATTAAPAFTSQEATTLAMTTVMANVSCPEFNPYSWENILGTFFNVANATNYLIIIQIFSYLLVTFRRMADIQKSLFEFVHQKPSQRSRCQTINFRKIFLHGVTTFFMVVNFALYVVKSIIINMQNDDGCGPNYFLAPLQFSWQFILALAMIQDFFSVAVRYHYSYLMIEKLCSSKCCKRKQAENYEGLEPGRPDDKKCNIIFKKIIFILSTTFYVFVQMMSMYNLLNMIYDLADIDRSDDASVIMDNIISFFLALFNVLPGAFNQWLISDQTGEPFFQNWCNRDRKNNFWLKLSTLGAALQLFTLYLMGAYKSIIFNFSTWDPLIALGLSLVPALIGLLQAVWFSGAEIAFQQLIDPIFKKVTFQVVADLFFRNPQKMCQDSAPSTRATTGAVTAVSVVANPAAVSFAANPAEDEIEHEHEEIELDEVSTSSATWA